MNLNFGAEFLNQKNFPKIFTGQVQIFKKLFRKGAYLLERSRGAKR